MGKRGRSALWRSGGLTLFGAAGFVLAITAIGSADNAPLSPNVPNLVSVTATSSRQVDACFNQPLATTYNINDNNFKLQGYSETRKTGAGGALSITGSPTPDPRNANCVIINYAPNSSQGGDVRTYSRAFILHGAVTSTSGLLNVQDAVPLTGSGIPPAPGATLRPVLIGASPSGQLVTYTFSEPVAVANPAGFGYYNNAAGDPFEHFGTQLVNFSPGSASVSVLFGPSAASATRFVVDAGAVQDANNVGGPAGDIGGATQSPDLANTGGRVCSNEATAVYTYVFNQPVNVINAAGFLAYDAAGNVYRIVNPPPASAAFCGMNVRPASGFSVSNDARTVTVWLNTDPSDASPDPAQITLETVAAGTATSTATGLSNSQGSLAVPAVADHPGLTTGPDLLSFSINTTTGFVIYNFDAPVNPTVGNISFFHLVEPDGTIINPPNQCPTGSFLGMGGTPTGPAFGVTGNTVGVSFAVPGPPGLLGGCGPSSVTNAVNAVGVTVDEGAAQDATTGVVNPLGALGLGTASPGGGGGTTGPTGPTGSSGTSGSTGTSGTTGTSGGTTGTTGTTTLPTVVIVTPTTTVIEKTPAPKPKPKPKPKKKHHHHKKKRKKHR